MTNKHAHIELRPREREALRRLVNGERLSAGERDVLFLNGLIRRFGQDYYPTALGESVYSAMV